MSNLLDIKLIIESYNSFVASKRFKEALVLETRYIFQQSKFVVSYNISNSMLAEVESFNGIFEPRINFYF